MDKYFAAEKERRVNIIYKLLLKEFQMLTKKSGTAIVDNLLDSIKTGTAFRNRPSSPQVDYKNEVKVSGMGCFFIL